MSTDEAKDLGESNFFRIIKIVPDMEYATGDIRVRYLTEDTGEFRVAGHWALAVRITAKTQEEFVESFKKLIDNFLKEIMGHSIVIFERDENGNMDLKGEEEWTIN